MSDRRHTTDSELRDLLVKRATERLTPAESARLAALSARHPEQATEAWDRAAAAVLLAVTRLDDALPPQLRQKLAMHARGTVGADDDQSAPNVPD